MQKPGRRAVLHNAQEIATGRWYGILTSLGVATEYLNRKHGPCPMCGGKDRFRFDDKEGRGTWICNKCGAGDGYQLLQKRWGCGFKQAFDRVKEVAGVVEVQQVKQETGEAKRAATLRKVWEQGLAVEVGDPVWKYLNRRIGIDVIPKCIRHHPALAYHHDDGVIDYMPAMIAAVMAPGGFGVNVHRTYLTDSGHKADVPSAKKLMPGLSMAGAAIRLSAPGPALGVAEGIETALAAARKFSVPVWSCISATVLAGWEPPKECRSVIVFGDSDASFAGQAAAYGLAARLKAKGIDVDVRLPDRIDTDWADMEAA
jgi:putative DNA primase/helicase